MSVSKVEDPSIPGLTRVSVKNEDPIIDAAKANDSLDANTEGEVNADAEGEGETNTEVYAKTMPDNDLELGDVCRDFITLDAIICTVVVVSFVTFFASLIEHVPKDEECVLEGF
jgi:hypothetical protein